MWANGLYLFTGLSKYQRGERDVQYCGITERRFDKRFAEHHVLHNGEINRERKIWLGTVSYPLNFARDILEFAEYAIIYFWKPKQNKKKKVNPPKESVILVSHWFKKDGVTPRKRQETSVKNLSDVICWDSEAKLWRIGNLVVKEDK